MNLKRWAVCDDCDGGGMIIIAAFDLESQAKVYIENSINSWGWYVEDMAKYLATSPVIPTKEEKEAELARRQAAEVERRANLTPLQRDIEDKLSRMREVMIKSLFDNNPFLKLADKVEKKDTDIDFYID